MIAVRLHAFGGPSVLAVERIPLPTPADGELLVRVHAAGVNHLDLDIRAGTSRLPIVLPHVLGMEVAGTVVAIGREVCGATVGDRVAIVYQSRCGACSFCAAGEDSLCTEAQLVGIHRPGGYAEYVVAPAESTVRLPDSVAFEDAAAVQLSFGTAWHALVGRAGLKSGETVLVSAAGGGVGTAALGVARMVGARVVASVGAPDKVERARSLGADLVVDYSREPLTETVRAATGGVDVVLEHVGGCLFEQSLRCLRPGGRIVVIGGHAGERVPIDLVELFRNQWSIIGSRRATTEELRLVYELLGRGEIRPTIDSRLPLRRAAEAHVRLAARQQFGKIVLTP